MRRISFEQQQLIRSLISKGESLREISQKVGVNYSTISKFAKSNKITLLNNRRGRKKILSERTKTKIIRMIRTGEANTAVEVAKNLRSELKINLSAETVRRALKEKGYVSKSKVKKPFLSKRHKALRLKFALMYKEWTLEDWKRIVWSDESKINRFGSDGKEWVWKERSEPLSDRLIKPTMKFGGGSLMIWGCFCGDKIGAVQRIYGRMNADDYIKILNEKLFASCEMFNLNVKDIVFQQDNDPKHKAKKTLKWFDDRSIRLLTWPPQSPDLNLIENVWSFLKRRLSAYETTPTTEDELWSRIKEEWRKIPCDFLQNLLNSMPKRLADLIRAKGGYTKY